MPELCSKQVPILHSHTPAPNGGQGPDQKKRALNMKDGDAQTRGS